MSKQLLPHLAHLELLIKNLSGVSLNNGTTAAINPQGSLNHLSSPAQTQEKEVEKEETEHVEAGEAGNYKDHKSAGSDNTPIVPEKTNTTSAKINGHEKTAGDGAAAEVKQQDDGKTNDMAEEKNSALRKRRKGKASSGFSPILVAGVPCSPLTRYTSGKGQ